LPKCKTPPLKSNWGYFFSKSDQFGTYFGLYIIKIYTMKKILFLLLIPLFLASCTIHKHYHTYENDDVYYRAPKKETIIVKETAKDTIEKQNTVIVENNYYDYSYATRIKRFHYPNYGLSYYSNYYSPSYYFYYQDYYYPYYHYHYPTCYYHYWNWNYSYYYNWRYYYPYNNWYYGYNNGYYHGWHDGYNDGWYHWRNKYYISNNKSVYYGHRKTTHNTGTRRKTSPYSTRTIKSGNRISATNNHIKTNVIKKRYEKPIRQNQTVTNPRQTIKSYSKPVKNYNYSTPAQIKSNTKVYYKNKPTSTNPKYWSGGAKKYSAPKTNNYSRPKTTYSKPRTNYSRPKTTYSNPRTNYSKPRTNYSNPRTNYSKPRTNYSKPRTNYSKPRTNYSKPRTNYSRPQSSYSRPAAHSSKPRMSQPARINRSSSTRPSQSFRSR